MRQRAVQPRRTAESFAYLVVIHLHTARLNTADRSIALVDSAMRRRSYFVEMAPSVPPVNAVLRKWLKNAELEQWPADLLDELNRRIGDPDSAIGPSYLMAAGPQQVGRAPLRCSLAGCVGCQGVAASIASCLVRVRFDPSGAVLAVEFARYCRVNVGDLANGEHVVT
jgi:hypothetical protein